MRSSITVNARDLGRTRMENFCPRCFWFTARFPLTGDHPFSSHMPGIVSTLDAYAKQVVNSTFAQTRKLPEWLSHHLGKIEVVEILKPKRWRVEVGEVELVGEPDALWKLSDGSLFIADYKTAQLSENQKALFPLYEAQLKAYAYLAEKNGHKVSKLALIYLQPQRYANKPDKLAEINAERFVLHFDCAVKFVEGWSLSEVEEMVVEVGSILRQQSPPDGKENCAGCESLKGWFAKLRDWI
ncbi:MAG: PD-(D/E)XK nuclease family protein [Armatimonadetes bacterium]|nr:PD-(D/E)XK nuclease family protein [Armatimonadota bacterium]